MKPIETKVTYKNILEFFEVGSKYMALQKEKETKKDVKLKYALKKVLPQFKGHVEDYKEKIESLKLDLCIVDETDKSIIYTDKGDYKFTVENTKKFNVENKKLLSVEVVIKPHVVEAPESFPFSLLNMFENIVIKEEEDK